MQGGSRGRVAKDLRRTDLVLCFFSPSLLSISFLLPFSELKMHGSRGGGTWITNQGWRGLAEGRKQKSDLANLDDKVSARAACIAPDAE